jgi:F0F1-type ATP synthase membrane subunit c/vacuolar-type H+-ATPase subunit K
VIDVSTTIVDGAGHGAKVVGTQVVDCVKNRPEFSKKIITTSKKNRNGFHAAGVAAGVTAGAAIIGSGYCSNRACDWRC